MFANGVESPIIYLFHQTECGKEKNQNETERSKLFDSSLSIKIHDAYYIFCRHFVCQCKISKTLLQQNIIIKRFVIVTL